jgi:hypothetical protein
MTLFYFKFSQFPSVSTFKRVVLSKSFNLKKEIDNFALLNALTKENENDHFPYFLNSLETNLEKISTSRKV